MKYIKFKKELPLNELLAASENKFVSSQDFQVNKGLAPLDTIVDVADGRKSVKQTLCYLKRYPTGENLENRQGMSIKNNSWDQRSL